MDQSTKATIDKYQAKLTTLEAQVRKIKEAINGLCELEGESALFPDLADGVLAAPSTIRPDQFFGRPMATVVREILTARASRSQGAISLEELYGLMIQGGFDFEGKDEVGKKRTLAITIGKNPAFVRVPNTGHIGLTEWYPNAKRPRSKSENGGEERSPQEPTDTPCDERSTSTEEETPESASGVQ